MTRLAGALLLVLGARAPIQCAIHTTPQTAREETPGEALWNLSERFRTEGNTEARTETLHYLIDRYPSSRFAERARAELSSSASPAP